jgi:chemotaxis protein CheD
MTDPVPQTKDNAAVMIGIGEFSVGKSPMSSIGLGSCVALILYDEKRQTGAMAHVMLPDSGGKTDRPGKYADTATQTLLTALAPNSVLCRGVSAKLVGGACMFEYFGTNLNIGERNISALRSHLEERSIRIAAEDTGGKVGRTVIFHPSSGGKVYVKRADGSCREI